MGLKVSKRHRPLLRVGLLASSMFLMGAVYSIAAPTAVQADGGTPAEIAAGSALFTTNCSSCHGLNGEGTSQGPSLVGVGGAAADFQVSTGRMPLAKTGQQAPRKTNVFTSAEVAQIAAYIQSLGAGPAVPSSSQYDPTGLTEEQIARGGELFRTNCSACHNISGKGGALSQGKYAPPIDSNVTNQQIYEALRTGPQQMPVFSKGALSDEEVRMVIAYLNELHASPDRGGFSLGGIGPVAEGLWAWIIGIGGCIGFALWIASKGARAR